MLQATAQVPNGFLTAKATEGADRGRDIRGAPVEVDQTVPRHVTHPRERIALIVH
jgi:hypothetical protein